MATKQIIALPESRKPSASDNITQWYNAKVGSSQFSETTRSHITGTVTTSNGVSFSENINAGGDGNIYSSGGLIVNVQTKTGTTFNTLNYIGSVGGISLSPFSMGQSFFTNVTANFTRNVVGFWAQINGAPTGSGDTADGCGKCKAMRVTAVYMDQSGRVRTIEMGQNGVKLLGVDWNATLTSTANSWSTMCYSAGVTNSRTIIDGKWMHVGWVINMSHHKDCGGNSKQKNCTGRIRYLTPLVSSNSDGGLYTGSPSKHQIVYPRSTWSSYNSLASGKYGIYTI